MNLPPIKSKDSKCISGMTATFSFSGEDIGDGSIEISDEGGGAFIILKSDGNEGIRMNPEDMIAFANWCIESCKEIDEFNNASISRTVKKEAKK